MQLNESLSYQFGEIRNLAHRTVADLSTDHLAWRPDSWANPIGWLVWHQARVTDSHVSEIAGRTQVWDDEWATSLDLPPGYTDTGYRHTAEQVAEVRPGPDPLLQYVDAATELVQTYLRGVSTTDFDRVIDRNYDPPVTVGIRFASVIGDALQHLGQAAYVRGLLDHSR